jgi:transposase-like protein
LRALHQAEGGAKVADICREHGVSEATYYVWKKKYSGLGLSDLRELRQNPGGQSGGFGAWAEVRRQARQNAGAGSRGSAAAPGLN